MAVASLSAPPRCSYLSWSLSVQGCALRVQPHHPPPSHLLVLHLCSLPLPLRSALKRCKHAARVCFRVSRFISWPADRAFGSKLCLTCMPAAHAFVCSYSAPPSFAQSHHGGVAATGALRYQCAACTHMLRHVPQRLLAVSMHVRASLLSAAQRAAGVRNVSPLRSSGCVEAPAVGRA